MIRIYDNSLSNSTNLNHTTFLNEIIHNIDHTELIPLKLNWSFYRIVVKTNDLAAYYISGHYKNPSEHLSGVKADGSWSKPLTSMYCRG
jgi:hypothetical protein